MYHKHILFQSKKIFEEHNVFKLKKKLIYCKIINFRGTFNFVDFVGKQNPRN